MEAIRTNQLTKSYGKARGIIDLNLQVEEGEFFGEEVPDIELSSDLSEEEREKFECFCIQSHKSSLLEDRR